MKKSQIILLMGMPASGKLTMAKRIAENGGMLIDNHRMHDLVRPFIEKQFDDINRHQYFNLIIKLWNVFFDFLENFHIKSKNVQYVFTNSLWDNTQDLETFKNFEQLATKMNADLIPITLFSRPEILVSRCNTAARESRGKLADGDLLKNLLDKNQLLNIEHSNAITIDVSDIDENATFEKITKHLEIFL